MPVHLLYALTTGLQVCISVCLAFLHNAEILSPVDHNVFFFRKSLVVLVEGTVLHVMQLPISNPEYLLDWSNYSISCTQQGIIPLLLLCYSMAI